MKLVFHSPGSDHESSCPWVPEIADNRTRSLSLSLLRQKVLQLTILGVQITFYIPRGTFWRSILRNLCSREAQPGSQNTAGFTGQDL